MRGEDFCWRCVTGIFIGSPPHARGRRTFNVAAAWSGSDHPRMRGEDGPRGYDQSKAPGSPPHARGRRMRSSGKTRSFRITPACAGKTLRASSLRSAVGDHPRMRGEDLAKELGIARGTGSPPHARGRLASMTGVPVELRITPACAGKTQIPGLVNDRERDHPRMRGEDASSMPS